MSESESPPLRVLIADSEPEVRGILRPSLIAYQCLVVGEAENAEEALIRIQSLKPDVCVLSSTMLAGEGRAIEKIMREGLCALLLFFDPTQEGVEELIEDLTWCGPCFFKAKPVKPEGLMSDIRDAIGRFEEYIEYRERPSPEIRETRRIVNLATKLIVDTYPLSEQEAFRLIQVRSMNKRMSMRAVAESIIRGDWKD